MIVFFLLSSCNYEIQYLRYAFRILFNVLHRIDFRFGLFLPAYFDIDYWLWYKRQHNHYYHYWYVEIYPEAINESRYLNDFPLSIATSLCLFSFLSPSKWIYCRSVRYFLVCLQWNVLHTVRPWRTISKNTEYMVWKTTKSF